MRPILALLLLTATSAADTPKSVIRGPSTVAAGATLVLDARDSVSDRPLTWKCPALEKTGLALDMTGRIGVIYMVPGIEPGIYQIVLVAKGVPPGAAELDADASVLIVTVGSGPAPVPIPPTPDPTPAPPAPPSPPIVVGTLHVSVVTDLDMLTPDMTPVRLGREIRVQQAPLDFVYRVYPSTSPVLDTLNLRFKYQAVGLPALIIQDAAGKVLDVMSCPTEESAVLAKVRSYREGK